MADTKISAAINNTTVAGTDEFASNKAGASNRTSAANLKTYLFGNEIVYSNTISPAQITANQNDYSPTGLSTASVVRLDADQQRLITGLATGANGRYLILHNVSAGADADIILKDESTSSIAANRFGFLSDTVLEPGESITLIYDGTTARWRRTAPSRLSASSFRLKPFWANDFLGGTGAITQEATLPWDLVAVGAGTIAKIASEQNHPGIIRFSSSTTANSGYYCATDVAALLLAGGGLVSEFVFQHRVAAGAATTVRMGFLDSVTSADAVDGAYVEIPAGSLAAVLKTSNNSTRTTSATIATLTVNVWYRVRIEVVTGAGSVIATIFDDAGNQLGQQTVTTNIPTAVGRETAHGIIATNSGTVATLLIYVDYMSLEWSRALA